MKPVFGISLTFWPDGEKRALSRMNIYWLHTSRCPRQMGLRRRERPGGALDAFRGMAQRHREPRDHDRVHCSHDRRHPLSCQRRAWVTADPHESRLARDRLRLHWLARRVLGGRNDAPLETCTDFVLPALVLAIGIGTVWLTHRDARRHRPAG